MQRSDFYFDLPDELIAQHPPEKRGDSRLLCLDADSSEITDRHFSDLLELVNDNDLLVFNNTRVMKARLYGQKESGGKVEILIERLLNDTEALAHIRASKSPRAGSRLLVNNSHWIEVTGRHETLFNLRCEEPGFSTLMQVHGHVPLPPYITREDAALDLERYQTIYGQKEGAVAAPTAGLHFTEELLNGLKHKGVDMAWVTLHVGAGTFQPVRVDNLEEHIMHKEWLEVSPRVCEQVQAAHQRGGRIIAIGTTSVRALESASQSGQIKPTIGDTQLFITPGYRFKTVDCLVTNFHLPESTLLMLVSALAGYDNIRKAYRHAIEQRYRFFSYGDAMLIEASITK